MSTATIPAVVDPAEPHPEPPPVAGQSSGRRSHVWLAAVLPLAVALAVGAYHAGARQLWEDEDATWHASTLGYADFARLIGHLDLVLAPYYTLMHGWIGIFGDTETSLRMPSVIAMAAAAGMLVHLGRRLYNTGVGVLAGLIFAAIPSISRYAQEARPYAIVLALVIGSTLLLMRAVDRPTWPRYLLYGCCLALVGLAHLVGLAIVAVHFLIVLDGGRRTGRLRVWRWIGALVLVVCVVLPFAMAAQRQSSAVAYIKLDSQVLREFPGDLFGSGKVAAALFLLAVVAVWLRMREPGQQLPILTMWALFPPAIAYVTWPVLHLFQYRYVLYSMPAWALLAAAGLAAIGRLISAAHPRWTTVGVTAVVLPALVYLSLPGQRAERHDPVYGYPDYRAAALAIHAGLQPGDGIAYGGNFDRVRRGMAYEMRYLLRPADIFLYQSAEQLGGYVAKECPVPASCLHDVQRIWLVDSAVSNSLYAEMPTATAALLGGRCTVVKRMTYQHLHLTLLQVNPA